MKIQVLLLSCTLVCAMGLPTSNQSNLKNAAGFQAIPIYNKVADNNANFHQASSVGGFQTPSSGGADGKGNFGGGILYNGLPSPGEHVASPSTFHGTPNAHNFGYEVSDALQGNKHGHTGFSDGKTTKGEYRVLLPDGRTQVVTYSADPKMGFMARVTYEGQAKPYVPPERPQNAGNFQYPSV